MKRPPTRPLLFVFAMATSLIIGGDCMKRFTNQKLNKKDHLHIKIFAGIMRIILTPIFILVRIYCWVWDYDYYERFKH